MTPRNLVLLGLVLTSHILHAQPQYPEHPDSLKKPDAPAGKIEGPFGWRSDIFPGTERNYWVYVPAQYDGSREACVMIVQDGLNRAEGWKLPIVMDNLIHQNEMPVTIGIFVAPGVVPARARKRASTLQPQL